MARALSEPTRCASFGDTTRCCRRSGHAWAVEDYAITLLTDVPATFVDELADLWLNVSLAGGSVGFATEVDAPTVRAASERIVADAVAGCAQLLVLRREGALVGTVRLERGSDPVVQHRAMLKLLMIDPGLQGQGWAPASSMIVSTSPANSGWSRYRSARSATGLEEYYTKIGWQEVGRFPGGVRLAPGDDRDEVWFFRRIRP